MPKLFLLVCLLSLISCQKAPILDKKDKELQDIPTAPAQIQAAAEAVVKISVDGGGSGTGFFISSDGLFITDDHVLGNKSKNCSKEGCFIDITSNYQRGKIPEEKQTKEVFAEPIYSNTSYDISMFQLWESQKKEAKVYPKAFLKVSQTIEENLLRKDLYLVGHHAAYLKKWSKSTAYRIKNGFLKTHHISYGGASGAPLLNDAGEVEGVLTRGLEENNYEVDPNPLNFSEFSSLSSFMSRAKSATSQVTFASLPSDNVEKIIDYEKSFLNLRRFKTSRGVHVLSLLENKCKESVETLSADIFTKTRWDFEKDVQVCIQAMSWFNCRDKDSSLYENCPAHEPKRLKLWVDIFEKGLPIAEHFSDYQIYENWVFGTARLYQGEKRTQEFQKNLKNYLNKYHSRNGRFLPLNFEIALNWIQADLTHEKYNNEIDVVSYIQNYYQNSDYYRETNDIIESVYELNYREIFSNEQSRNVLNKLFQDKKTTQKELLKIDSLLHGMGY